MTESRTKNVVRNSTYAIVIQIVNVIIGLVVRTVFIKTLNQTYLGIEGVFTNILTLLSFAELGVGEAITFKLYKPLAQNNIDEIVSIMHIFKKMYRIIGGFIIIFGTIFTPFIKYIVDVPNIDENIYIIYILYVINTGISYLYIYKKTLLIADQKSYIANKYTQIIIVLKSICQIFILLFTKKFLLYLITQVLFTFISNYYVSKKIDKLYPYLMKRNINLDIINKEKKEVIENIKSIVCYKFGSVILDGTDNIIISILFGVMMVAKSSNYLFIINYFSSLLYLITNAMTASIGNLNVLANNKRKEEVLNCMLFIVIWMYGFSSFGMYIFFNDIITIWCGSSYLLETNVVIALLISFFITKVHSVCFTYRTTLGLYKEGKYGPILAAVLNLVLSVLFGIQYGIMGVFIATSVSRIITLGIIDPVLIYKKAFRTKVKKYYLKYSEFTIFLMISSILPIILNNILSSKWKLNMVPVIIRIIIFTIIYNLIFLFISWKSKEFMEVRNLLMSNYRRKR